MPRAVLQPLCRRSAGRRAQASQGFALPIAVGGSLLLLLSSGSLQLLALQNKAQVALQQRRLQIEDTLASAAQQQLAALQAAAGGCLLRVDQSQWGSAAASCALSAEQVAALQHGVVADTAQHVTPYRISSYRVAAGEAAASVAQLELQLQNGRPWRGAFRLSLAANGASGTRITALQELGLRGARS